jgi:hypothetical protein
MDIYILFYDARKHEPTILSVGLCGCETWTRIVSEEHELWMLMLVLWDLTAVTVTMAAFWDVKRGFQPKDGGISFVRNLVAFLLHSTAPDRIRRQSSTVTSV